MKKTAIHAKVLVHDARPHEDHATIAIRFSPTAESMRYWYVRAQRNNLDRVGRSPWDHIDRKTLVRWEAERIEHDPFAAQWDTVPNFGTPYSATLEADAGAMASECFGAFIRAIAGRYIETPSQLLAILAADRRIALTIEWEWTCAGNVYVSLNDVPLDRRWACTRFLASPEVLEAKAALLLEQAESQRARLARVESVRVRVLPLVHAEVAE